MFFVSISIFQGMRSSMKGFVSSSDADASGNHTLYFQGCQQSLSNELFEVICLLWTQLSVLY